MFEAEFAELLPHQVTVEPFLSQDGNGVPSYGAPVTVRGRVDAAVGKRTNTPGEQRDRGSLGSAYLSPTDTAGALYTLSPLARLTLPAGFSPQVPPVVAVLRHDDGAGVHHWEARLLMQASALRKEIAIDRPQEARDEATGETEETWFPVITLMADVRPIDGEEAFREAQLQAWGVVSFRTSFLTDGGDPLTTKYRIRCQGVVYDLLEVRELGQREGLELIAKARRDS